MSKKIIFDINFKGDSRFGLNSYCEELTLTIKSINSGGFQGYNGQFADFMKECLQDWYEDADIITTEIDNDEPRVVALLSGSDWGNACVEHLIVPYWIDLRVEKQKWNKWLEDIYFDVKNKIEYVSFDQWLRNLGAKDADDKCVEIFWSE